MRERFLIRGEFGVSSKGNKIIKAGLGYTIGNYLLKGLSFFTLPLFTRLLSTSDYGFYNTFYAYEAILAILIGLALHSSLKNAKYKFKDSFNEYCSSIVLLIIISGLIWILVGNAFYSFIAPLFKLPRMFFNLLLVYSICSALLMVYNSYISLSFQYKTYLTIAAINLIFNILLSVLLILTLFSANRGYGRVIGSSIPILAIGIYILFYFSKNSKMKYYGEYWSYGVKYSLPIVPHGISQMILLQFDRIMINSMIGASAAGIYGFSYSIYSIISITGTSIDHAFAPWFYEKMENKEYSDIKKYSKDISFGMLLLSIIAILFAPEAIKILGSEDYWEGVYTAIPLVVAGYFSFMYLIPSCVEYYYAKTKYIALGTSMAAVLNILLNYFFIKRFGYIAASYTTLFTYVLYFLFHYFMAWRIHGNSLFDTTAFLTYSLIIIAVNFFVIQLIPFWYVRWIIGIILGIFLFKWIDSRFNIMRHIRSKVFH